MDNKTVFFFQALWEAQVKQEELLNLMKKITKRELTDSLGFFENGSFLFLSKDALHIKASYDLLKNKIEEIEVPRLFLGISREINRLSNEFYELYVSSKKELSRSDYINLAKIHCVYTKFSEYALGRVREEIAFRIYRILILSNNPSIRDVIKMPQKPTLSEWFTFFNSTIVPLENGMSNTEVDSRWAYKLCSIELPNKLIIKQFVSVSVKSDSITNLPGLTKVSYSESGEVVISGRGKISNINPLKWNLEAECIDCIIDCIPCDIESSYVHEITEDPHFILDRVFLNRQYIISPRDYFEYINKVIVVRDLT